MNNSPCAGFDDWLLAAKLLGRPCITHARGPWFAPRSAIGRWLTRRFDRVIAISRHIAADMAANGVPRGRLRQVYDGIDTARWRSSVRRPPEEVRESIGVGERELLVLMVGHIKQWKGQHVAVEALEHLEPQVLGRLRLVFVGEAPADELEYEARLRRTVAAGGLERRVTFLGARDDVPDLMNAADIVLHASTTPEPFGLVVVEAMALGKPVIAARLGGPTEIVDRCSGLLFDPTEPSELARALATIADDPLLREELGAAARTRTAEFELASNVAGVEAVYSEVLGAPTARSR
jgi:glycosyltransferase involved in cell wall biosynthesis